MSAETDVAGRGVVSRFQQKPWLWTSGKYNRRLWDVAPLKWPRLFEQKIRVAKWIVGRG
jgi:hypothetical protein